MSTSKQQPRPRKEARGRMDLREVVIGGILLLAAFLVGPIGAHIGAWKAETGALLGGGGALGGLILWCIIHSTLVKKGVVHEVDPALQA